VDLAKIGGIEAHVLMEHLPDSTHIDIWPWDDDLDQITKFSGFFLDVLHEAIVELVVFQEAVLRRGEHVGEAHHLGRTVRQR
jgi:hypothetical protein